VLIRVEKAFRRHQLHDLDIRPEGPAMRRGAVAQFLIGLGQADIHADLAGFRPCHQKLQGNRRLAGAGAPLQQMQPVAGEPPVHDLVEASNAGGGSRRDGIWHAHRNTPGNILPQLVQAPTAPTHEAMQSGITRRNVHWFRPRSRGGDERNRQAHANRYKPRFRQAGARVSPPRLKLTVREPGRPKQKINASGVNSIGWRNTRSAQ
jgi:hypothetical protein